jgi:hypothetical protein
VRLVRLPRTRCVRYAHVGDQRTAELRGLRAFKWMRTFVRAARLLGSHARVHIGAEIRNPCPDELLFLLMPATPALADYIETCRRLPGRSTVIDVHADVLRLLSAPVPEMAVSHDGHGDSDGWVWWSRPDRQDALTRSIRAADVVTTPWPQMVEPLRSLNPNVVLLPDFDNASPDRFMLGFRQVKRALPSRILPTV